MTAATMNEHQTELLHYMEQWRKLRGTPPEGWEYSGMEDFLIREGTWYDPSPLPRDVQPGAPKNCFANSLLLALMDGFTYVEGLAIPDIGIPFPVNHAWNLTPDGEFIDSTWSEIGLAYIGVPFSVGRADNVIQFGHANIFDNPRERGALYRQRWQGEDWSREWRKSKIRQQAERIGGGKR